MAKYRTDEGSNSDSSSGSLKEIMAGDFKPQDGRSRVWMSYPVHRNYNQDLYSFAWAQAVQNKPLGIDVKPLKVDDDEDDDDIEMYVEDNEDEGEKEEGEIEEGEIDRGSELMTNVERKGENVDGVEKDLDLEEKIEEIGEFDKRFGVILEELETITVEEAQSSFEEVCSRLQKCFASLKGMFSEGHGPILDVLAQQAFVGIQTVCSAYSSGNSKNMDQNKELLLRLLIHIKNQYSVFLSSEQVKEIDVQVHELASEAVSMVKTTGNLNGLPPLTEMPVGISAEKLRLDPRGTNYIGSNIANASLSKLQPPTNTRSRVDFSPLLNLHEDYDEDSLPSPTRDNPPPPLPVLKPIGLGAGAPAPAQTTVLPKNVGAENGTTHPYVTDAFKAVSSYQQKYGKNSILTSNRLPSPTPSEDGNDGDDDINGEVSSSAVVSNVSTFVPRVMAASSDNLAGQPQLPPVKTFGQVGLDPSSLTKASAKSRDPRLRFLNPELGGASQNELDAGLTNSRKCKAVDEPVQDDHNVKRQRNGSTNYRDVNVPSGGGSWIEGNGMGACQTNIRVQLNKSVGVGSGNMIGEVGSDKGLNANNNLNGSNGVSATNMSNNASPAFSLPSLLKDIAVNPTLLMQLVKMEQQRIAADAQMKAAGPAAKGLSSGISSAPEFGKNPAAKHHMPAQNTPMNTQNDTGKIRMKPRDPRRILHSNVIQKTESFGPESTKTSGRLLSDMQNNNDNLIVREQGEQAQTIAVPSQSASDVSQQFSKNLQNFSNIVSSSPAPTGIENASQPIPSKISNGPSETKITGLSSQGETPDVASQSANPWGCMDHLLEGYDDQEKAAIQEERARRIAEQNKMFAARKLCLVLDLDHTLLNSAKFGEVDQIHEEILRKKEEQDKQKPERHLYCFPHMGMWTKLRPGVWKFLEKASQLYELHLYTMGNKLYATEMAKILDPKGTLFSGRVISRGDNDDLIDGDDRAPKSKDLDGVLGMESAVVIIDDSVRVWPHNKLNLIAVERYTYFPSSRRQFGLLGPSLLEIDHDERPEDGTLASSLAVIERIHQNFFSHHSLNEADVRTVLASEQRKILAGCKIVFSRVFPVGEANPHLHPLWQTAEQFGAECTNQIDEHVTHVVANSLGTDKVNWALSTGRFVVHPGWVEASALLYRRASEQDFAVKT